MNRFDSYISNSYVKPPLDQILQYGMMKDKAYAEGAKNIQDELNSLLAVRTVTETDKNYVNGVEKNFDSAIQGFAGKDLSDPLIQSQVSAMINGINRDQNLQQVIANTQSVDDYLKIAKTKGHTGEDINANLYIPIKSYDSIGKVGQIPLTFDQAGDYVTKVHGINKDIPHDFGTDTSGAWVVKTSSNMQGEHFKNDDGSLNFNNPLVLADYNFLTSDQTAKTSLRHEYMNLIKDYPENDPQGFEKFVQERAFELAYPDEFHGQEKSINGYIRDAVNFDKNNPVIPDASLQYNMQHTTDPKTIEALKTKYIGDAGALITGGSAGDQLKSVLANPKHTPEQLKNAMHNYSSSTPEINELGMVKLKGLLGSMNADGLSKIDQLVGNKNINNVDGHQWKEIKDDLIHNRIDPTTATIRLKNVINAQLAHGELTMDQFKEWYGNTYTSYINNFNTEYEVNPNAKGGYNLENAGRYYLDNGIANGVAQDASAPGKNLDKDTPIGDGVTVKNLKIRPLGDPSDPHSHPSVVVTLSNQKSYIVPLSYSDINGEPGKYSGMNNASTIKSALLDQTEKYTSIGGTHFINIYTPIMGGQGGGLKFQRGIIYKGTPTSDDLTQLQKDATSLGIKTSDIKSKTLPDGRTVMYLPGENQIFDKNLKSEFYPDSNSLLEGTTNTDLLHNPAFLGNFKNASNVVPYIPPPDAGF